MHVRSCVSVFGEGYDSIDKHANFGSYLNPFTAGRSSLGRRRRWH